MRCTTEDLLTHPDGFGIQTATPVQRASCRIGDGLPLEELAEHPDVILALGGVDAVAALPSERGIKPREILDLSSPRTAKTIRAAARAIVASQTIDLSRMGPGEMPRVSIVSTKLDIADVPFNMLLGALERSPRLKHLIVDKREAKLRGGGAGMRTLLLKQMTSGRLVEVACVAGGRAANGLVARWSAGVIFDEAPRMQGQENGAVVNLDEAKTSVRDRMMRGATIQYVGSPWLPAGPAYQMYNEFFGKPSEDLVVINMTGPQGNPFHYTPEYCEYLRRTDPAAWRVAVLGMFVDPIGGLLDVEAVRRNTRQGPVEIPPGQVSRVCAGLDPGKGRYTLDLVDVTPDGRYRVAAAREFTKGGPKGMIRDAAKLCAAYGVQRAWTDQYAGDEIVALAAAEGLTVEVEPWTGGNRIEAYTNLVTLTADDRIEFSPEKQFQTDLYSVQKRITQDGWTVVLPRTADGRHADHVPALASALRQARGGRNELLEALIAMGNKWTGAGRVFMGAS
jgi:hypothetical protein